MFCCFNGPQKITRFTFLRWMEILKRTDGSVLWLLESAGETKANLKAHASESGVDPGRLIFAPKQPNARHLARYGLADLFLDTAPYGAHTTASDALFMGVPVLTFRGRSFAARVCGSLVSAAGLPDLVCEGPRDYVERAIALARDRQRAGGLKARLEAGRGELRFVRHRKAGERPGGPLPDHGGELSGGSPAAAGPRQPPGLSGSRRRPGSRKPEMACAQDYAGLWRAALAPRHLARPWKQTGDYGPPPTSRPLSRRLRRPRRLRRRGAPASRAAVDEARHARRPALPGLFSPDLARCRRPHRDLQRPVPAGVSRPARRP